MPPLMPMLRMWVPSYPLAQLFAYAAGTTTKQNTFTSSTLLTPNSNPIQADANGLFGAIYLDPALAYKFVLAPSTDTDPPSNPLFTQDNVTTIGGQTLTVLAKTATYTVLVTDGDDVVILADATGGAIIVNLYTAAGNGGKKVRVVKIDSSANPVTIDPFSTQTWGGATSVILSEQYAGASGVSDNANWQQFSVTIPEAVREPQCRVTATSGLPVTTADVTAATSVYVTPCRGNRMWLPDSNSVWRRRTFAEITVALAGLTASKPYDLFAYDNLGAVAIETNAWRNGGQAITGATNATPIVITAAAHGLGNGDQVYVNGVQGTTAANGTWIVANVAANTYELQGSVGNGVYTAATGWMTARASTGLLALLNGMLVKSAATTRLYLGTVYINSSGGQTDDAFGKRNVWNHYNQRKRPMRHFDPTASWTYQTAAYRQARADATNQLECCIGWPEQPVAVRLVAHSANDGGAVLMNSAIGEDSTTAASINALQAAHHIADTAQPADIIEMACELQAFPIGRHVYTWLEKSTASGTTTWYGTGSGVQSGMLGELWG